MTSPTRDDLIALAYSFFPRGLAYEDPGYFRSPEYQRYEEAWARAMADERWETLLGTLKKNFPALSLGELTVPHHDAARRFAIYLDRSNPVDGPEDVVVGCVSVVAPFYCLYGVRRFFKAGHHVLPYHLFIDRLPDNMVPYARTAAQHIERIYDYRQFPSESLGAPIPDISSSSMRLGEMTLLNAFFSTGLDAIP